MPAEYEEHGFYWPASLFVDSDGMIHIRYYSNDMIMIIDPTLGVVRFCCNVVALADGALTLQMDNIAKRSVRVCLKGC